MEKTIKLKKDSFYKFNNNVDFCVGTGRMGLALTKEYFDQLKFVQSHISFKYIRGHGLFCDDMAIYQETDGKTEYNFTYLDRVIDSYLELNIRPFIELGFMPEKLASGTQTIFYWKGNTTPPKEYGKWCDLVKASLQHLIDRYGKQVLSWPVEVWNEPNLPGFWEKADMNEYFNLYEKTAKAVKEVSKEFCVGGPAICGGQDEKWMKGFLNFCQEKHPPLDFISRHHYTTQLPVNHGHYGYAKLMTSEESLGTLKDVRKIIDSYKEFKDLPFYITEFNTSYIPNCPIHDTNLNAAYLARTLVEIGDYATAYSYWTFGDVFEERGVPFTPFHGGFGLVANGIIPKPTFWTFKFFKDLANFSCVYRDENIVIVQDKDFSYKGVAWNLTYETKELKLDFNLDLGLENKNYVFLQKIVDEETCNPLKIWHDLGEPANPSLEQIELLRQASKPLIKSCNFNGNEQVKFSVGKNAVHYFEIKAAPVTKDNGYTYEFYADYKHQEYKIK